MESTGCFEIQNNSNDSSSKSDNLDYNIEEEEIFVENIIELKNIKVQKWLTPEEYYSIKNAEEIILDNPLESHIKDSLLKKSAFEVFILFFEDILCKFAEYSNEKSKEKFSIHTNYNIDDIIKYIFVFFISIWLQFSRYIINLGN